MASQPILEFLFGTDGDNRIWVVVQGTMSGCIFGNSFVRSFGDERVPSRASFVLVFVAPLEFLLGCIRVFAENDSLTASVLALCKREISE
jgi:hypothetical protein